MIDLMLRTRWDNALIERKLSQHIADLNRMPSANELRRVGANDLACAIARRGGFYSWQKKMGVAGKDSGTHRGQRWERWAAGAIAQRTRMAVTSQTTKSPFDLDVCGVAVDVKSARWTECGSVSGFIFSGCKYGKDCDLFFFVCLHNSRNRVRYVFALPSSEIQVHCVTISPRRIETWSNWRDDNAYETIRAMKAG